MSQLTQFLRYKGLLDLVCFLCALKAMFCNLGTTANILNFHFLSTPLQGGWGKELEFKIFEKFCFRYFGKVEKFQKYKCISLKVQENIFKGWSKRFFLSGLVLFL